MDYVAYLPRRRRAASRAAPAARQAHDAGSGAVAAVALAWAVLAMGQPPGLMTPPRTTTSPMTVPLPDSAPPSTVTVAAPSAPPARASSPSDHTVRSPVTSTSAPASTVSVAAPAAPASVPPTKTDPSADQAPPDSIVMDTAEWDTAANTALAVTLNEPLRRAKLLQGEYEVSAFFDIDGCPAKCRFDIVAERGFVVDLKTTQDASQFERSVVKWGYHRQAALYQMGAAAVGVECKAFIFVVVETAAPYGIRVVTLDSDALIQGEREVHRAAKLYRECMETGEWPGYSSDLQTVSLPLWALDQED